MAAVVHDGGASTVRSPTTASFRSQQAFYLKDDAHEPKCLDHLLAQEEAASRPAVAT